MTSTGLTVAPGIAVVLRDGEGRVLLHRRHVGSGWAPVSGHLEPGESIAAGLRREVDEETGLTMLGIRLVGVYSDPDFQIIAFPDGRRVQFVTTLFIATTPNDSDLSGSDEATAWDWFYPHALPDRLLPYAERWLADALATYGEPVVS